MSGSLFSHITHIREHAEKIACKTPLYQWSLQGSVPDRLLVKPVDTWPGDEQAGRYLCSGAFSIDEDSISLQKDCWEPEGVSEIWLRHMHGFEWLRDLRALGGQAARTQARELTQSWIRKYKNWQQFSWQPAILGKRITLWISHFDSFFASADDSFQELYLGILLRQAKHLSRSIHNDLHGIDVLQALQGLLYAGLSFENKQVWIEQALTGFEKEIKKQILPDGGHISRQPGQLLKALQIILDVRMSLSSGGYPCPGFIQHAIDKMGPAMRFFKYNDKGLALFQGSQEENHVLIEAVLAQANTRGKALQSMPCSGYERMAQGRTMVMVDTGKTPPYPYDKNSHVAPLSFEFCYGKQRVLTSCGTHPTQENWKEALRATPAHNSVTIEDRNACEILKNGHLGRKIKNIVMVREDNKDAHLIEASHDGYYRLNGITHNRRLFLSQRGNDFRGEETLTSGALREQPLGWAIRFHIHPSVKVSLIREGEEALLRLPGGAGFRFHHCGGILSCENSIYLGQGSIIRKTKQLVLSGDIQSEICKIKWALQREG